MFYTSPEKPYELAVLDGDDLTYETPITDDVIGYLNYDEVLEILSEIEKLPPKTIVWRSFFLVLNKYIWH